jgi:hypothetical protein
MTGLKHQAVILAAAISLAAVGGAAADAINQNFNGVTGVGGGPILVGSGFNWVTNWDNGITGENAFAGTNGFAQVDAISAFGAPTGGKNNTGAGVLSVSGVSFNMLEQDFAAVTGVGGGTFLVGDGTPDTTGYTAGWDTGIYDEAAFAGTANGAAIATGGGASATGLLTGGYGGGGGGQIKMNNVVVGSGMWYAGLQWQVGAFPGAAPLYNPGFDENGIAYWTPWGNAPVVPGYDVPVTPHSGTHVLKMWGQFTGGYNTSGAYQELPAQPGQVWELSAQTQHASVDAITGTTNHVDMAIEFWGGGQMLESVVTTILDGNSPTNVWIPAGPVQRTAPTGTTAARVSFLFVQEDGTSPGSGVIDSVSFKVISGPSGVNLANHSLTAKVQGVANTGAGETLGRYQLRLEDSDGDRLIFSTVANGNWQTLGGALNTATEANSLGVPTAGAFNVQSPWYRVVIAFDNDAAQKWGKGGTLNVDDLLLSNSSTSGGWYAGLFWDHLAVAAAALNTLRLNADVLGSVPGGKYVLRVEAMANVVAGLNESFTTIVGNCGAGGDCIFLDPNDVASGTQFKYTTDWDTGITGEGAFGGVYGGTTIWEGGGISAKGLTTGGLPGRCAEIRVENMILGPAGSGWYAGLDWANQGLASHDLSQVTLSADVWGATASGGTLGKYELRIEDAEGDRLYWLVQANDTWQHVGGALSTATEGPALDGGGNGVFDLDSSSYNVAIAFADEAGTWTWGGALRVDNVYLTPVTSQRELGRISFHQTATGDWQTVGGKLSEGESTFKNLDENFNAATGVGGGEFWASGGHVTFGGQPFDTGLNGEETFAGVWGSGTMGTETAAGCTNCGVGGSGAATVSVTGAAGGASGGWWAGLTWLVSPPDWSDLSQILMTANVKASKLAPYQLRIEDFSTSVANPVWFAYNKTNTSTTNFEAVGGPLSGATSGCPSPPCAAFNFHATAYRVTLVYSGGTWDTAWGTGGTLTLDNLFLTGITFFDADSYTVTLAFENELATWGTTAQLKVDNLVLGAAPTSCAGDLNCDGVVSFADINPFVQYLSANTAWVAGHPGCNPLNGDINGDGTYGQGAFSDINPFVTRIVNCASQPGGSCPCN